MEANGALEEESFCGRSGVFEEAQRSEEDAEANAMDSTCKASEDVGEKRARPTAYCGLTLAALGAAMAFGLCPRSSSEAFGFAGGTR